MRSSAARATPRRKSAATLSSPSAARSKIHPYDAQATIAGAGTVALEWEEDLERLGLPALDTVLVAVGGGGLLSGVAAWFAGRIKVVGVEPEGSRALGAALEAGAPVDVSVHSVAADSLGARRVGDLNLAIAPAFRRPNFVLVPDTAILEAQRRLWRDASIVAEPGGPPPSPPSSTEPTGRTWTNASACSSAAPTRIWRRSRRCFEAGCAGW